MITLFSLQPPPASIYMYMYTDTGLNHCSWNSILLSLSAGAYIPSYLGLVLRPLLMHGSTTVARTPGWYVWLCWLTLCLCKWWATSWWRNGPLPLPLCFSSLFSLILLREVLHQASSSPFVSFSYIRIMPSVSHHLLLLRSRSFIYFFFMFLAP